MIMLGECRSGDEWRPLPTQIQLDTQHTCVYAAGTLWVCGASIVLGKTLPTMPARAMLRGVSWEMAEKKGRTRGRGGGRWRPWPGGGAAG